MQYASACSPPSPSTEILEQANNFAPKIVLEFKMSHAPEVAQGAMLSF